MTEVQFDRPVRSAGTTTDDGFAVGVVALVDLVLITVWTAGEASAVEAVAVHVLTTVGTILTLIVYRTEQTVRALGTGALLFLLGPLGGPVLAASRLFARWLGPIESTSELRSAGDQTSRHSERIHQQIVQGRRYSPSSGRPDRFKAAMSGLDSAAQHSAIATITRNYAPEMRPALDMALRSPNAALRVQAAAVFAKLRTSYAERATEVLLELRESPRGPGTVELAREARSVALSGFVEDDLKRHLLAVAKLLESRETDQRIGARHSANGGRGEPEAPRPSQVMRYSCGGLAL